MTPIDYAVLVGFMVWLLIIGAIFSLKMKDASQMFAAGGQSPWWVSGLSGFMTIFSAGTFVVWGGIAYRLGLVAVSILMVTGISAIFVGPTVASRWRASGITTPTEYLRIRFSEAVVQVYTWLGMFYRGIGLGVGLYALAVMLAALVPLPEGAPFRDATTGNLSVPWGILLWGTVVIIYTMLGGLWAVLMTDVIQFLILSLVVLVAVPLSISAVGGVEALYQKSPEDFFLPATQEYSYAFLTLWFLLGYFRYASDWAFVQRYICVPTARDAKKVAYLMGGLYAISPILWMLPALCYRVIAPNADPEQAYVLICCKVLPAGMLGIMVAAMFSATASMISSLLNVFAGVFSCDVYRALLKPSASEKELVLVGRLATLIYGIFIIAVAICVPYFGGAEEIVLVLTTALMGPLFVPIIWGLFSKRISSQSIWTIILLCAFVVAITKVTPILQGRYEWFSPSSFMDTALAWLKANSRFVDACLGLVLPILIMSVYEVWAGLQGKTAPGWDRLTAAYEKHKSEPVATVSSRLPALIVASTLGILGLTMLGITLYSDSQRMVLAVFSAMLLFTAASITYFTTRLPQETS